MTGCGGRIVRNGGDMCHYGWNGESWDSYDTRKGDEHLYNLLRPGMYCVNVTIHFKK